jgi:hypothetical protein
MTNWKSLQDSNPEPSLLDAIAHAEKKQLEDRRSLHNFINAWAKANGVPVVDVSMSDLPMLFEMPSLKDAATYIATFGQGEDK